MSPKEIIEILNELYEDGRHKTIVDSIEELPKSEWNYDIKIHLARAYNNTSEYDKALNILMSEDTKNEKDAYWNYVVGYAYFHKWNYISALNHFEKSFSLGRKDVKNYLTWCKQYINNNKIEFKDVILEWFSENAGIDKEKLRNSTFA